MTEQVEMFVHFIETMLRTDNKSIIISAYGDAFDEDGECFSHKTGLYITIDQAKDLAKDISKIVKKVEREYYEDMISSYLAIPSTPKRHLKIVSISGEGQDKCSDGSQEIINKQPE